MKLFSFFVAVYTIAETSFGAGLMAKWSIEEVDLPLAALWSISRGSVAKKTNLLVTYKESKLFGHGEVAFITGGEQTIGQVRKEFERFEKTVPNEVNGLQDMVAFLEEISLSPNLRFAIECAYVNFLAELMEDSVERVLGVREVNKIQTSYSIPILEGKEIEALYHNENLSRFSSLKIKVKSLENLESVSLLLKLHSGKVRIDGNECFKSAIEVLDFLSGLDHERIEFIEQPLDRSNFQEARKLRSQCPIMIMADESLQDGPVLDQFQEFFHGVNIKLQKSGGFIKAMNQLKQARMLGLKTMLGCMIESSLGISSAMAIGHGVDFFDLDGFLLLKKDPFDLVYEEKGNLYRRQYQ